MKLYNGLIIVLVILLSYADGSRADVMDDFVKSIKPDLSRKQAIRFAMERTFEIQSADNLKRKLKLYLDSVNDVAIVTRSIGLTKQQLDEIIHALGYILAQDIMSDGVYSIEEIRKYAKLIEPKGTILNEVIEGMKLEIELRKWRHRNKLIKKLMDAGLY
jgi:ADP-dependent phosphofructokinase/glucokinase